MRVQIKLVIRDNLAGNLFEVGKVAIDRNLLLRKQKDLYITIVKYLGTWDQIQIAPEQTIDSLSNALRASKEKMVELALVV